MSQRYFNKFFMKNYDEKKEAGYILEVDVEYPKELCELHGNLPFLPERKKLVTSLEDKNEYIMYIKSLKVYRVISFNQDGCLNHTLKWIIN